MVFIRWKTVNLLKCSKPFHVHNKHQMWDVVVIGHGILAGKYLAEYRDSLI